MTTSDRSRNDTAQAPAVSHVVVGCDGAEGSEEVLAAAAYEARQHAVPLRVLVAYEVPVPMDPEIPQPEFDEEELASGSRLAAQESWQRIRDRADFSGLDVRIEARRGNPAHVLIDEGGEHGLIVVGRRHKNLVERLLLGSTCSHVAKHADCAVLLVPLLSASKD